MPIYEFYCPTCNVIYNFFTRRMSPARKPACPKCGRPELEKLLSRVSVIGRASAGGGEESGPDLPVDDARLEQAMGMLEREMEGVDENDPRAAAGLMRKLAGLTGMNLGEGMEEAIRRMEAGEDPDQVEAEMGDVMESPDELLNAKKKAPAPKPAPRVDEELYEY